MNSSAVHFQSGDNLLQLSRNRSNLLSILLSAGVAYLTLATCVLDGIILALIAACSRSVGLLTC